MLWVLLWFESSSVEKKMYGKGIKWYDYCKKRYKTGNMLIALTLHNHAFILQCACSHYTVGTNHFQCSSLTALFPVQQRNLVNKQSWLASTAAHNNYTSEARARQGGIKNPKRVYPSFLSAIILFYRVNMNIWPCTALCCISPQLSHSPLVPVWFPV